jgi:hypothetical protein
LLHEPEDGGKTVPAGATNVMVLPVPSAPRVLGVNDTAYDVDGAPAVFPLTVTDPGLTEDAASAGAPAM